MLVRYTVADKKCSQCNRLFNGVYKKIVLLMLFTHVDIVSTYFLFPGSIGLFVTIVSAEFFFEILEGHAANFVQCSKKFINSPHWSIAALMTPL